jgi:pilus assembly protein CpaE
MNFERFKISILHGSGAENPEFREVLKDQPSLKLWKQALDPETFVSQHADATPDLVLVDLDGLSRVPDWLEQVIARLPRSEIVVCSKSRDPDFLIRIMQLRVGSFISLPLQRQDVEEAVARLRAQRFKERAECPPSQVVMVTGVKGGVGTTAVATNLAVALAEAAPGEVILLDLARPFPQVGQILNLKGEHTLTDLLHSADHLDAVFLQKIAQPHKSTLGVILSTPDFDIESPTLMNARALGKMFAALRGFYSWIVVDAGAWLDFLYAKLAQEADQVLVLTELAVPDLQNLRRLRGLFQRWELDEGKVKVVVNRYAKDYTLSLRDLESVCGQPAFYTLPSDYASLIEALNQGLALPDAAPRSKLWRRIKGLAEELIARTRPPSEAKAGFLRRLFQKG